MDDIEINDADQAVTEPEPETSDPVASASNVAPDAQRATLARLREALLATEPAIDPALVSGESLEELDATFKAARAAVARIREAVRMEQAAAIGPGAPGRSSPGPATALDKIKAGLAEK